MDKILNYERSQEDDFYMILGCDELSSTEQINAEYKVRALNCHPDKHPNDKSAAEKFARLQRAKEVLSCAESKQKYDNWRRSGLAISYAEWCAKNDTVKVSMHWASKGKKEPMLQEGPSTKPRLIQQNNMSSQDEEKLAHKNTNSHSKSNGTTSANNKRNPADVATCNGQSATGGMMTNDVRTECNGKSSRSSTESNGSSKNKSVDDERNSTENKAEHTQQVAAPKQKTEIRMYRGSIFEGTSRKNFEWEQWEILQKFRNYEI